MLLDYSLEKSFQRKKLTPKIKSTTTTRKYHSKNIQLRRFHLYPIIDAWCILICSIHRTLAASRTPHLQYTCPYFSLAPSSIDQRHKTTKDKTKQNEESKSESPASLSPPRQSSIALIHVGLFLFSQPIWQWTL